MSLTQTGAGEWAKGAEYSVPAGPAQIVRIFGASAENKSVMEYPVCICPRNFLRWCKILGPGIKLPRFASLFFSVLAI